jgi:hypothetical protein
MNWKLKHWQIGVKKSSRVARRKRNQTADPLEQHECLIPIPDCLIYSEESKTEAGLLQTGKLDFSRTPLGKSFC